jgi:hypothetical protein
LKRFAGEAAAAREGEQSLLERIKRRGAAEPQSLLAEYACTSGGFRLLEVLGAATVLDAMAILQARCNNGANAANGEPGFAGPGLSAIPAENGGAAGQA